MRSVINIGYENYIITDRIIGIVDIDSAPIKRMIKELKRDNRVIDATKGHKSLSVIFTQANQIYLSAVQASTLIKRMDN